MRTWIILLLSAFSLSACTTELSFEEPLRAIAGEELVALTTIGAILEDGTLNASDVEVLVPTEETELITGAIADVQRIADRYTTDQMRAEALGTAASAGAAIEALSDELENLQLVANRSRTAFENTTTRE